jgi:hypothetical protein
MKKHPIRVEFLKDPFSPLRVEKPFLKEGRALRDHFEKTFRDPYRAHSGRFCWDYWSVPGQYRLLRTPAGSFFPEPLFRPFLSRLLSWGRETLGCQMISHPWLSAYTDGCFQNLHSDVPHGPFSFVYSLTPWGRRSFTGGETLMATPTLLRYFSVMSPSHSHEEKDFLRAIPALEHQLAVFDPRYPHGVRTVQGVESVLDSRLVIHGWFTEPRTMLEGSLSPQKVSAPLDGLAASLLQKLTRSGTYSGLLSIRLNIQPSGRIGRVEVLTSHLLNRSGEVIPKRTLTALLASEESTFPKSAGPTRITLPLEVT